MKGERGAHTSSGEKNGHLERLRLDDMRAGASARRRESARDGMDTM